MITWHPSSGASKIAAKEAKRDYSIITVPDPNFEWPYWKLRFRMGKKSLKIHFSCNSLEICCEYSYKSSLQMTPFQFLITWKVTDLLHHKHVFICKNQEKSRFFPVGKIKTSYFMIGENNHKKRGGCLLAMTSSSTTLNFISLSQLLTSWRRMTSLMSDHFFTYTQCQKPS